MGPTIGVIIFIIIVAIIALRHDKKVKSNPVVTPPVRTPTDEQQDNIDKRYPNR
mgnify:CR=1 FL=1